jgi:hypothetical protein
MTVVKFAGWISFDRVHSDSFKICLLKDNYFMASFNYQSWGLS